MDLLKMEYFPKVLASSEKNIYKHFKTLQYYFLFFHSYVRCKFHKTRDTVCFVTTGSPGLKQCMAYRKHSRNICLRYK